MENYENIADFLQNCMFDKNSENEITPKQISDLDYFLKHEYQFLDHLLDTDAIKRINSCLIEILNGQIQVTPYTMRYKVIHTVQKNSDKILDFLEDFDTVYQVRSIKQCQIALKKLEISSKIADIGIFNIDDWKKVFEICFENKIDVWHTNAMTCFLEEFANLIALDNAPYLSNDIFDMVYDYIDSVTFQDDFQLYREKGLSDIMQLMHTNLLSSSVKDNILDILEKNLSARGLSPSSIDIKEVKNKLNDILKNKSIKSRVELEDYINALDALKIYNLNELNISSSIDDKYLYYVFMMAVSKKSYMNLNRDKYQPFLERVIEDIGRNDALSRGIPSSFNYCCFTRELPFKLGVTEKNLVQIEQRCIESLFDRRLYGLETLYHENTHIDQIFTLQCLKNSSILPNYKRYVMLKEQILRSRYRQFYSSNYSTAYVENEAEEEGLLRTATLVYNIFNRIQRNLLIHSAQINKRYITGRMKRKTEYSQLEYVVDLFDSVMLDYHENLLKEYPILSIEYDKNGRVKSPKKIISGFIRRGDYSKQQMFLIENILENGNAFKKENFEKDLCELRTLLSSVKNPELKNFIRKISSHLSKFQTHGVPLNLQTVLGIAGSLIHRTFDYEEDRDA